MKIHQTLLGAAIFCALSQFNLSAAVNVTPASGGANLSSDTAANSTSSSWTSLGPITIAEAGGVANRGSFNPGKNVTLILKAPAGFQFNHHITPSITFASGRDISSASIYMNNPGTMTVTLTITGVAATDSFVIGSTNALQVRPVDGTSLVSGNIYRPASGGSAVMNGLVSTSDSSGSGGTSFGALNQIAGTVQRLAFTVQPAGAAVGAAFGTQPVIRTQDQFGNNSVNGLPGELNVTTLLSAGTGSLLGTTVWNIGTAGANGIISHTDLEIDTAGTGKRLSAIGGSLTSALSSSFSVTKGNQTITFDSLPDKIFGDAPFALGAVASSGLPVSYSVISGPATVSGDTVTLTGAGVITIRAAQSGNINWNAAVPVDRSFTAGKATPSITWSNPDAIVYGTGLSGVQLNATALPAGTFTYDPADGAVLNAGTHTLSVTFFPAATANYNSVTETVSLDVLQASLSAVADNAARNYGEINPMFSGSLTGVVNGDNITVSYSSSASATDSVGNYPIVPALIDPDGKLSNYDVTTINGTLTINPRFLGVNSDNATREYGTETPVFSGGIGGVVNDDAITVTFACSATEASPVGTYEIIPSLVDPQGKLGNYSVSSTNGTLTITGAALTVVAEDAIRTYGSANPLFSGAISGIRNGDNITATYDSSATEASSVGSYPIESTLVDPDGKLSNYLVSATNGTLTIEAAVLVVTADDATRLSGTTNPVFSGTITGIQNSDNLTATYSCSADETSGAGTYDIVPSLEDPDNRLGNYSLTIVNGTLTITDQPIQVSLSIVKLPGQNAQVVLTGNANQLYRVEAADTIDGTWQEIQTAASDTNGSLEIEDTSTSATRFYRAVAP